MTGFVKSLMNKLGISDICFYQNHLNILNVEYEEEETYVDENRRQN